MVDIKKCASLVAVNLIAVIALTLQLYGVTMLWKLYDVRKKLAISNFNLRKRNLYLQKWKIIKQRRLHRKKTTKLNIFKHRVQSRTPLHKKINNKEKAKGCLEMEFILCIKCSFVEFN